MSKRRSHVEFVSLMSKINPKIQIIGKYEKSGIKIHVKCLVCGHEWMSDPSNLLRGYGCKKCADRSLTKTHETFISQMEDINPDIDILSKYVNDKTKVLVKCKKCGNEWYAQPSNLIQGFGCPKCFRASKSLSHDEFIDRMKDINSNIIILGNYNGAKNKIKCQCAICGNVWETKAITLLNGHGCAKCYHNSKKKTHDEFVFEMKQINPNIEILGEYNGRLNQIKCKCLKCGNIFESKPSHLLSGRGCPKCNRSKGENEIERILSDYNITFYNQYCFDDCRDVRTLPFDFYIPDKNVLIEYDGEQHFRTSDYFGGIEKLNYIIYHDQIKDKYCKENGITLIRIPYTDFSRIEEIIYNNLVA